MIRLAPHLCPSPLDEVNAAMEARAPGADAPAQTSPPDLGSATTLATIPV